MASRGYASMDGYSLRVKSEPVPLLIDGDGEDCVDDVDPEDGSFDMIDLFRDHPCLYNTNLRDYRDKDKKAAAIAYIAATVGRSENAVRKKIKVLRTIYTRYKKEKILRNGDAPCWKNAERLSFLDQFSTPRFDLMDTMPEDSAGDGYVDDYLDDDVASADWLEVNDDEDELRVLSVSHKSNKRARYSLPVNSSSNAEEGRKTGRGHSLVTDHHQRDFVTPPFNNDNAAASSRYQVQRELSPLPLHIKPSVTSASVLAATNGASSKGSTQTYSNVGSSISKSTVKLTSSANVTSATASHTQVITSVSTPATNIAASAAGHVKATNGSNSITSTASVPSHQQQQVNISSSDNADDVFGRYIGLELKAITDINSKRLAKLRIQTILYDAQTGALGK